MDNAESPTTRPIPDPDRKRRRPFLHPHTQKPELTPEEQFAVDHPITEWPPRASLRKRHRRRRTLDEDYDLHPDSIQSQARTKSEQ